MGRVEEKLSASSGVALIFAADAQVAYGVQGLGQANGQYRTRPQFLDLVRGLVADGVLDGVLMTPADAEQLAARDRIFRHGVTPIVRMNAETGIWGPRHGAYRNQFSLPFPTVRMEDAAYCDPTACHVSVGMFSITLNNDVYHDERMLSAYLHFAQDLSGQRGFVHVLEAFLPNTNRRGLSDEQCGAYVADSLVRTMSYLLEAQRPILIKTEYTTPANWRSLCAFDPTLRIGALGGPNQGPRYTLQLAHDVVANGGRAILFGRAIFEDSNPPAIVRALRQVVDGQLSPADALQAYQAETLAQRR
ncbi:MAG: hypothetical protein ACYCW6_05185 [Candidatus Xenobia bacterium]